MSVALDSDVTLEDAYGGHGLRIYVTVGVKNVGNSMARNVSIRMEGSNMAILDLEGFVKNYFDKQIAVATGSVKHGELLAPTETHSERHGIMVFDSDLGRLLAIEGRRFVAPIVAVIVTYRAVGTDDLMYTGRIFSLNASAEGGGTMAIDLDQIPIKGSCAGLISLPQYAQAS